MNKALIERKLCEVKIRYNEVLEYLTTDPLNPDWLTEAGKLVDAIRCLEHMLEEN